VHGDVVAIEVLPESEWRGGSDTIVEEETISKVENADTEDQNKEVESEVQAQERKLLQPTSSAQKQATAKVVGIIKRNWRTYPFTLLP
jgi:exosome complex exonuclease DIS3/RRP44